MPNENVEKLRDAKNKIAGVYEIEASDEVFDTGFLSQLNQAVVILASCIKVLKAANR